jgi:MFS family permease
MMEDLDRPPVLHETPSPPDAPSPQAASPKSALLIVFLVVFIDLFGFGIVLPLLPRYGREMIPGGEHSPWAGPILGALMAAFSAMQFFFAPVWGRVSDRVGRRPILLLGLASSVVFYTLFGVASTLGSEGAQALGLALLFVSRIGAGIAGATISTAQAVIADCTSHENRSRGMALIGAAFGIGFFFGPLLGFGALTLFPHSAGGPGFLAAILSFVAGVLGFVLLPETLRPGVSHGRRKWFDLHGLQTALRVPGVGRLILIFFLSTCAFACFEPTLALLTTAKGLGLSDQNNFLVFAYVGLVLALCQGVLYRRLALRVRELTFMWMGTVLMGLGLAGVGVIAWSAAGATAYSGALLGALLAALAVAVVGFGFMVPSVQALISRLSDPAKQGEILGVNQSANAISRILGPALGVPLFYLSAAHELPYVFSTALLALVLLLIVRLRQSRTVDEALAKEAVKAV